MIVIIMLIIFKKYIWSMFTLINYKAGFIK